jgi:hypothetical protein
MLTEHAINLADSELYDAIQSNLISREQFILALSARTDAAYESGFAYAEHLNENERDDF